MRTNHAGAIATIRAEANRLSSSTPTAIALRAAADLLEVHDATGISLDNWDNPAALVNWALDYCGYLSFEPNGA